MINRISEVRYDTTIILDYTVLKYLWKMDERDDCSSLLKKVF